MRIKSFFVGAVVLLAGCANFDSLSKACDNDDAPSCFKAGEYAWTMRPSDLTPCASDQAFCIQPSENRAQAVARLKELAIEQNGQACDQGDIAEACLRAGSMLASKSSEMPLDGYKEVAAKAEAYFEKGCVLGSQMACMFRGTTYRAGT